MSCSGSSSPPAKASQRPSSLLARFELPTEYLGRIPLRSAVSRKVKENVPASCPKRTGFDKLLFPEIKQKDLCTTHSISSRRSKPSWHASRRISRRGKFPS